MFNRLEIKYFSLVVSLIGIFATIMISNLFLNSVNAQKYNFKNTLLTYENSTYGISIKYPNSWQIDESGGISDTDVDIVTISSPYQVNNVVLDVHQDKEDDSNNNLTAFLQSELLFYKNNLEDFQVAGPIVNSLLAGNNAYKMNYTYIDNDGSKMKSMEIGTIIGNKVYYINYNSQETLFDIYLPIVQVMVDSFKVTSTNNEQDELKK